MSDDAPRKLSWFRFHLSTLVVLSLTAGVLMWANMRTSACNTSDIKFEPPASGEIRVCAGFPYSYKMWNANDRSQAAQWFDQFLIANILNALAILTAVAVGTP